MDSNTNSEIRVRPPTPPKTPPKPEYVAEVPASNGTQHEVITSTASLPVVSVNDSEDTNLVQPGVTTALPSSENTESKTPPTFLFNMAAAPFQPSGVNNSRSQPSGLQRQRARGRAPPGPPGLNRRPRPALARPQPDLAPPPAGHVPLLQVPPASRQRQSTSSHPSPHLFLVPQSDVENQLQNLKDAHAEELAKMKKEDADDKKQMKKDHQAAKKVMQKNIDDLKNELVMGSDELVNEKIRQLEEKEQFLKQNDDELKEKDELLKQKDDAINDLKEKLAEEQSISTEKDTTVQEKSNHIKAQEKIMSNQTAEHLVGIKRLQTEHENSPLMKAKDTEIENLLAHLTALEERSRGQSTTIREQDARIERRNCK